MNRDTGWPLTEARQAAALVLVGVVVLAAVLAAQPAAAPAWAQPAAPAQQTIVRCDPATVYAELDELATLYLYVQDVVGLNAVDLWLTFNTGIGAVVDLDTATPGVQIQPLSEFLSADLVVYRSAENSLGEIRYAATQVGKPERTGSGRLAKVQFEAAAPGTITLQFSKLHKLADGSGVPIAHTVQSCQVVFGNDPTAVKLASFSAAPVPGAVEVRWETASEVDLLGFNLFRSNDPEGELVRLNEALIPSRQPGSPVGAAYQFVDRAVGAGTYYYWLDSVDLHGATIRHGPVSAAAGLYRVCLPLTVK